MLPKTFEEFEMRLYVKKQVTDEMRERLFRYNVWYQNACKVYLAILFFLLLNSFFSVHLMSFADITDSKHQL